MNLKMSRIPVVPFLACLLLIATVSVRASEGKELVIDGSRSPDGQLEISMVPDTDGEVAAGICKIREIKTGKLRGSFDWAGFGVLADSTSFNVLWRPDSRCFAISWELDRGYMTGTIYAPYRNKWVEIKYPEYLHEVLALYNKSVDGKNISSHDLSGKGCETPKAWLPNNELRIEITDRAFSKPGEGDSAYLFWATFRIVDGTIFSKPHAILKKVEFAPKSAYNY